MVFSPPKSLTTFDVLDLSAPVFMVYLRSIKMVFLCDPSYVWLVLPNKKLPVSYLQCFNLRWSTLVVSALKILFLRLSETSAQLICLCAPYCFYPNVPLEETIEICCDVLFYSSLPKPIFPESVFKHLINFATSSVEFSFNNIMYRQIDGMVMGSSLGPTLANNVVGFYEANLFNKIDYPPMYYRYVDDTFTFCLFKNVKDVDLFLAQLNSMHSSLKFIVEKESNHRLPFLDVFVHKTSAAFLTSVYRKPTFSGLYTRWDSFCPQQRKINLIKTLVYRVLMISSKCFLGDEIKFIKSTLSKNGYPLSVLDGVVHDVKFDRASRYTVNKCPVYLRLPYIGSRGERFAKSITVVVGKCYFSAAVRVIFQTCTTFVSMRKDVLPPHHINSVIYKYTCSCGSDYIGRTSNRLDLRIKQHLPARILNLELKRGQLANTSGSSIAEHMINSWECVADFNVD